MMDKTDRPICNICETRPAAPSMNSQGRQPTQCLSCAAKSTGNQTRMKNRVRKYEQRYGPEAAQEMCREQGVAYPGPGPGHSAAPTTPGDSGTLTTAGVYAAALSVVGNPKLAASLAGLGDDAPLADLEEAAREHFEDLIDGDPRFLGRLSRAALAMALFRFMHLMPLVSPGQLGQTMRQLGDMAERYGGTGLSAASIEVVLSMPDMSKAEDETDDSPDSNNATG